MGIFNQQPNSNYTKEKRGITGPQGPPGPAGVGFSLNSDGNYDIKTKKLTNITDGTGDSDVVSKKWIETHVSTNAPDLSLYLKKDGSAQLTGNWTVGNHQIYLPAPDHDNSATRKVYVDNHFLRRYQAIDLHNNFINRVKAGTQDTDAVNKKQMDDLLAFKANDSRLTNAMRQITYRVQKAGDTMTGALDMGNNKITNLALPTSSLDAINKSYLESKTPQGVRDNYGNFDCQQKVLFNNKINGNNIDVVNVKWVNDRFLKLSGGRLSGNLDLNSNRLYNVPDPTGDKQPVPKKWLENNYLNKSNGVMAGPLNMSNNKITHLAAPIDNNDAANKTYVDNALSQSHITPSHYNNEFAYAMVKNQWSEEDGGLDTFDPVKVENLEPHEGNYHTYNHKVLYLTIKKNNAGGYMWEMGLNIFRLEANKDYTLCIEILMGDYLLWHKSIVSVNTTASRGVTISHYDTKKFSHRYTDNGGSTQYMYYNTMIINLQKTAGNPHIINIRTEITQAGIDLNTYPTNYDKVYVIAYGMFGKLNNIDADKVYDYHTAFDIQPTKVVYNVDLDMNRKKILNIAPDKTKNNSAATVKMVKDLEAKLSPHTTNNAYRKIFEEFYDFGDFSNYRIVKGPSGIEFTGLSPNITCPRTGIANIRDGGMRLTKTKISLQLFSKKSFTLCVVMQLWLNRAFSIKTLMSNGAHEKPHLIYDKTTKKLKLQTNGLRPGSTNETSITLLNEFNGKRVVLWLTKKGTGSNFTVKASISNYSGTLTLSSELASQSDYTFKIFSEDAVIYRVMYSPNVYDFDSSEFHQIMLQEKLKGSYIM